MSFANWKIQPEEVFNSSAVIPVLVIKDLDRAVQLAEALIAGGINVLEITMRTPVALDAVRLLRQHFPHALIGVGTVINPDQLNQAIEAGAHFAISPGLTDELLSSGINSLIPLIPGISTASELMNGINKGYTHFKFFPAVISGGVPMLRALHALFPQVRFCPTGGINAQNYKDYLALANVSCVGGSWLAPEDFIKKGEWSLITDICLSMQEELYLRSE